MKRFLISYVATFASIIFLHYFFITISSSAFNGKMEHQRKELQSSFLAGTNSIVTQQLVLKSFDVFQENLVSYVTSIFAATFFSNVIILSFVVYLGGILASKKRENDNK